MLSRFALPGETFLLLVADSVPRDVQSYDFDEVLNPDMLQGTTNRLRVPEKRVGAVPREIVDAFFDRYVRASASVVPKAASPIGRTSFSEALAAVELESQPAQQGDALARRRPAQDEDWDLPQPRYVRATTEGQLYST
ncbi:MAG: hypothetical protein U0W40_12485 [Acidimicrobiia bacterium]